jgi:flagellar hook-associated protein 2
MGLALSGLASGFDWKSIVDQLIEVSRAPQNRMRKEQSANATKTTALNEVKSLLSSLKSSLSSLSSAEALQKKSATFRDSTTDWTATADADSASGTYNFSFVSEATTSKYQGATGIATAINPTQSLSQLSVGRTLTAGNFTVDGVKITITTAQSLDDVLANISGNVPGVTASYNAGADKIELSKAGGGSISLGASNDTSNFLQAMRLTTGTSPVTTSGPGVSSPRMSGAIDSANISGWSSTAINSSFSINGVGITYNSATDSIQSLLNRINDSEAGVTATYDVSAGSFLLTNKETGNVGISVTDDTNGLAAALGFTTGTLTAGDDAVFSVNGGGNITSRSNTLDEYVHGIAGLSVTANSIGSETITVSSNTTAAKDAINTFIEKYNAVQNAIEKYTKVTVDGTKVSSAVLAGSRELATISRELRRILYASQDGNGNQFVSGSIQRLSDLGVGFSGIENTISITNSTTLSSRLASDSDDVIEYFTTADDGLVDRLDAMLDRLVSSSSTTPGTFQVQLDSISKQNKSLDKQIEEFERRLESQRSLLESSFIAMERAQSGFQQQSAYLQKTFSGNSK